MSHLRPRVDAMRPMRPEPTRTAPPRPPEGLPTGGRFRSYIAFGFGGFFLMSVSLLVLRVVWALGNGEAAWNRVMASFQNPLYVIFHALAFVWLTWFILRLFRLFPGQQSVEEPGGKAVPASHSIVYIQFRGWGNMSLTVDPGDRAPAVPVGRVDLTQCGSNDLHLGMLFCDLINHCEEGTGVEFRF